VHFVDEPGSNQTRVVTFVLVKELTKALPDFAVVLPESLALWAQLKQKYDSSITKVESKDYSFFLSFGDIPLSQLESRFCTNQDAFRINNGIPEDWIFFESADTKLKYFDIFKNLGTRHFFSFFLRQTRLPTKFDRKWIFLLAGVVSTYFLLVWLYLSVSLDRKQQQLETVMGKASEVLEVANKYEETNQALSLLTERLSDPVKPDIYLQFLHYLMVKKVELTTFSKTEQNVLLRGEATSATTVLMEIKELPYVIDAVFDSPVSRDNEKDRFVIRVRLKNPSVEPSDRQNEKTLERSETSENSTSRPDIDSEMTPATSSNINAEDLGAGELTNES